MCQNLIWITMSPKCNHIIEFWGIWYIHLKNISLYSQYIYLVRATIEHIRCEIGPTRHDPATDRGSYPERGESINKMGERSIELNQHNLTKTVLGTSICLVGWVGRWGLRLDSAPSRLVCIYHIQSSHPDDGSPNAEERPTKSPSTWYIPSCGVLYFYTIIVKSCMYVYIVIYCYAKRI